MLNGGIPASLKGSEERMSVTLNAIRNNKKALLIHLLNVGNGDSIIVETPEDETGERATIIVDCHKGDKTKKYLEFLGTTHLDLVVATHPHRDHILGLPKVLRHFKGKIIQFWDSGFRHNTGDWDKLVDALNEQPKIRFVRPTAGLSTNIGGIQLTVLAPSISLRNRYDSYGVNINNASIVLKLDYQKKAVILAGDAQWDSWGKITEDFPHFFETTNPDQKIQTKRFNPLECDILKVAHHGSKHGTSLEAIEKLGRDFRMIKGPKTTIISHAEGGSHDHPDQITMDILQAVESQVITTVNGSIILSIDEDTILCYKNKDGMGTADLPEVDEFKKVTLAG